MYKATSEQADTDLLLHLHCHETIKTNKKCLKQVIVMPNHKKTLWNNLAN